MMLFCVVCNHRVLLIVACESRLLVVCDNFLTLNVFASYGRKLHPSISRYFTFFPIAIYVIGRFV